MQKYLSVLWLFTVSFLVAQPNQAVIPAPHQTQFQSKTFTHKGPLFIQAAANSFEAQFLAEALHAQLGIDATITQSKKAAPAIILTLDSAKFPEQERYQLAITPRQINIQAGSNQGLFYGVQTLLQLMPIQKTTDLQLACLTIEDQPKYAWRGMHLDVARHFFPTSFIKKYIDYLATYKFNTFHWHHTLATSNGPPVQENSG